MKGMSYLSGVIVVVIVIASTTIVVNVISPSLDEAKSVQRFNEAKQLMASVDEAIRSLMMEATGAKRSLKLDIKEGAFSISGSEDIIRYRLPTTLLESGTRATEGNLEISSGAFMKAYEADANGDGSTDYVLENDLMLFAMKKLGSSSSYVSMNTTTVISLIKNKRANVNSTPTAGIYINDIDNSSYGNGYTELYPAGQHLQSASIRLWLNSTEGTIYDAVFTLRAGMDFVEARVSRR